MNKYNTLKNIYFEIKNRRQGPKTVGYRRKPAAISNPGLWYGMVWYGMVWYGMVWYGMVWYGMVWYGMVWYGMVCGEQIYI